MIAAEWVALTNALQAHPNIRSRVGQPWRVKRMEPDELRSLAVEMGISMEPIQARVREVMRKAEQVNSAYAPNQPTPAKHEGAFAGVVFIPLALELLARRVEREARVSWGYTPAWDHYDRRRRCMVSGAREAFSLRFEISAEPDHPAYRYCRDGHFRPRPQRPYWLPLDFLADGLLPSDLNEEIEGRIDREARDQDRECRRALEAEWRAKHNGPWRPTWRIESRA
jgi:hypothetical protein